MSEDLIRRNDAVKVVRHSSMEFIDADTRQKLVEAIPTIEPKCGRWIYQFRDSENEEYRCSECNYIGDNEWAFCPYCGAYMKGGKE